MTKPEELRKMAEHWYFRADLNHFNVVKYEGFELGKVTLETKNIFNVYLRKAAELTNKNIQNIGKNYLDDWTKKYVDLFSKNITFLEADRILLQIKANTRENSAVHSSFYYASLAEWQIDLKTNLLSLINSEYFEVKIEIIKKTPPPAQINQYEQVKILFAQNHFDDAWKLARDTFQQDIENTFNADIKHYENLTNNSKIDQAINNFWQSVSVIRNAIKEGNSLTHLPENRQRAIAKLAIELLMATRNYLAITQES